ncbi:MAG: 3-hydroxybutyryl-CoA dehydrogenase, partial [Acidimicrobiaceae bacterium]|nr:3-hydroxybutyryl-CoA dehydrogenase [Acidimicrobiaceae bacterium]
MALRGSFSPGSFVNGASPSGDAPPIERVGVVGAGLMGSGIAECVARSGIGVVLHEPEESALGLSRKRLEQSLQRALNAEKIDLTTFEET